MTAGEGSESHLKSEVDRVVTDIAFPWYKMVCLLGDVPGGA